MEITGGSYVVSIPVYEGPMDLLLHLVSKNRIEIHDIPIHEITDQYLEYLNQAQVFNLELGSSFFTMAATLLLIKSRMLLPKRAGCIRERFLSKSCRPRFLLFMNR